MKDYSEINTLPELEFILPNREKGSLLKITPKNLSFLEALESDLFWYVRPNLSPQFSKELLEGNNNSWSARGWIIALHDSNEGVGFINYQKLKTATGCNFFSIELYVSPKYHRLGIATAAFNQILKYIKEKEAEPVEKLMANIHSHNTISQKFAEKLGFEHAAIDEERGVDLWVLTI
jgi:RimJ/RimL family protein N-acetyltransferase